MAKTKKQLPKERDKKRRHARVFGYYDVKKKSTIITHPFISRHCCKWLGETLQAKTAHYSDRIIIKGQYRASYLNNLLEHYFKQEYDT